MRRFLNLFLVFAVSLTLWFGFAQPAKADAFAHLTPCSESAAYQQRAKSFRNTTDDPNSGKNRAARYSQALCGPEGLPRLIVDGRFSHAGDFTIPGLLFLYITGAIGWAGRSYLMTIRKGDDAEMKEIIIDVPLAVSKFIAAGLWPLAAVQEYLSGTLTAKDSEIPTSPR